MRFLLSCMCLFFSLLSLAQTTLQNPSFEDTPSDAMVPHGWFMCNDSTTPDILPGFWGVRSKASDGATFCGLITRPDGSYEFIGQRLTPALEEGECYNFSLDLAHSHSYAGYNEEIQLRIWLGSEKCKKQQLIFESEKIGNRKWKQFKLEFNPKGNMKYISIEAYSPSTKRGNILIDNLSSIGLCDRV